MPEEDKPPIRSVPVERSPSASQSPSIEAQCNDRDHESALPGGKSLFRRVLQAPAPWNTWSKPRATMQAKRRPRTPTKRTGNTSPTGDGVVEPTNLPALSIGIQCRPPIGVQSDPQTDSARPVPRTPAFAAASRHPECGQQQSWYCRRGSKTARRQRTQMQQHGHRITASVIVSLIAMSFL